MESRKGPPLLNMKHDFFFEEKNVVCLLFILKRLLAYKPKHV